VQAETFLEIWKRTQGAASGNFEEDVFWQTLYPHARPFARILWPVWRGFFEKDLGMIRRLGAVTSGQEAHFEVDNQRYQHPEQGLLRRYFRLRVSGKRLIHLVKKTMKAGGGALPLDGQVVNPVNSQPCFPTVS
jgi:hypothetical protein